jgi:hypothetical protein
LFGALKQLYNLRSVVVHGGDDATILKAANKLVRTLEIGSANDAHPIGRLSLISKVAEEWLTVVFKHLAKNAFDERPYQKTGGWEELLWGAPAPVSTE